MIDNVSIWQLYIKTLSNWAQVSARDVFSVTAINTFSDLGNADPAVNNWSTYQLGDSIPAPNGNYSPRSSLFVSYWLYLTYRLEALGPAPLGLLGGTPKAAPDFEKYRQLVQALHPGRVTANNTFASTAMASGNTLNTLHENIRQRFENQAPALYEALDRCRRAGLQEPSDFNMACANTVQCTARCPSYSLAQWPQMLDEWRHRPLQTFLGRPRLNLFDRIKVNLPAAGQRPLSLLGQPAFIGIKPEADKRVSSAVSMSLSLERFGSFAIKPAPWFDPGQLDRARPKPIPDGPDFLGPQGAMGLLPAQAVLGFRPNLVLHASSQPHAQALADNVTRIGPFSVNATAMLSVAEGSPGSCGDVDVHFDSQQSDLPVLLGVISHRALA